MIIIHSFPIDPSRDCKEPPVGHEKEGHIKRNHLPITYWNIYLNDNHISFVSSNDLAEQKMLWIEKLINDRF